MNDSKDLDLRFGRFVADSVMGRGGMGVVYRAHDPVIGRRVAIKALRTDSGSSGKVAQEMQSRFELEFRSAGTLSHPNIVTIYDVGQQDDTTYIAMEIIEGKSLEQLLREGEVLSMDEVCNIASGLCSALDYAQRAGIVHRDIKPANILMADGRSPKITDFGIAKVMRSSSLTQTGTVIGTPSYMAPEQVLGKTVSGATDQFAAAVIFYQMLTGDLPFGAAEPASVLYRIVHAEPAPPTTLNPKLPPEIDGVLLRALNKDPARRFPTCSALAAAMRSALLSSSNLSADEIELRTRTVTLSTANIAPGSGTYEGAASWWQRKTKGSRIGAVAAVLFFLALGLGGVAAWMQRDAWLPALTGTESGSSAEQVAASGPERAALEVDGGSAVVDSPNPRTTRQSSTSATVDRGAAALAGEVLFTIVSTPSGAQVSIDGGAPSGVTPLDVSFAAGTNHRIRLQKGGYSTETFDLTSHPDMERRVQRNLRQEIVPGRIEITAPYSYQVTHNGSALDLRRLDPGRYTLRVRAPDVHYDENHLVTVEAGQAASINLPPAISVRLIAIANGKIRVDGGAALEGPVDLLFTNASAHRFRFEWDDGVSQERTINLNSSIKQVVGSRQEIVTR